MLGLIGITLIIVGFVMIFRMIRNSRRPRIDGARVLEIKKEFYVHKGRSSPRKFPTARVEYYYNGAKLEAKVLLKSKPKPGDGIKLSVKPDDPTFVEEYYPLKESLVILAILAIGTVLLVCSIVMTQRLSGS
jgi:hypothetical protein